MFVKNKLFCKWHRHLRYCQNQDSSYPIHTLLLILCCSMIVAITLFTPSVSGQKQMQFPDHEPNFSRRHFHRHQRNHPKNQNLGALNQVDSNELKHKSHRSASLKGGSITNEITSSSNEKEVSDYDIVDNSKPITSEDMPGSSSTRPKVCSSCINRELYRNLTLMQIKEDILKNLNMSHGPPQVSRKDVNQHLMQQIVENYRDTHRHIDHFGDRHFQPKQITVLAQKPNGHVPDSIIERWDIQYFSLDSPILSEGGIVVRTAKLFVHLPSRYGTVIAVKNANNNELDNESQGVVDYGNETWIHTYYVVFDKKTQSGGLDLSRATRVELKANHGGWVDIDLMAILPIWLKYPNENMGLYIKVTSKTGENIPVGIQHQTTNAPFLQIDLEEDRWNNRLRRNTNKMCTEKDDKLHEDCCLWDFVVDFERDFGWEWVIHPPKYRANYCNGNCGLGVMMTSTPHAHLMQQSNIKIRSPCCAPQKLSGISMLYLDTNHNVILQKLSRMKVGQCGCA